VGIIENMANVWVVAVLLFAAVLQAPQTADETFERLAKITDAMGLPPKIVKQTLGAAFRLRGRLTFRVGNLGCQNVHFADFRGLCEKVGGFSHQRSGHFA